MNGPPSRESQGRGTASYQHETPPEAYGPVTVSQTRHTFVL